MCVYLYHIQKTTLKVGSAIYKLVVLVKYHNKHYSHLYVPQKTILNGFISVTLMYVQNCISYNQSPIIQVTPVSTATIIQQDPFMLFYQLDEGTNVHALFI